MSDTNTENNEELSVVDIANFCLLVDKYKSQINQEMGDNSVTDNAKFFLNKCSESLSAQLKIMDDCQKVLYKSGYNESNIEIMKSTKRMFEEGLKTLQKVLEAFEIVLTAIPVKTNTDL